MARSSTREKSGFSSPVTDCRGVGPKTAAALQRLGIDTVERLLYHFPRSYLDRRKISPIASVPPSGSAVIMGEISRMRSFRPPGRPHITECVVSDESGSMKAVWFNQPYLKRSMPRGTRVILSGEVSDRSGPQMNSPDFEILAGEKQDFVHTLGIVPVYPLTQGVGQKQLRRLLRASLDDFLGGVPENLPPKVIEGERLLSRREALGKIHFPSDDHDSGAARERFAFEEFLALQLGIQSAASVSVGAGIAHDSPPTLTGDLEGCFPFELTSAQRRAVDEIAARMQSPRQMNALLQGDVGSGKTIVALFSMLKAIENGRQAILMAPTEILAEQHVLGLNDRVRGLLDQEGIEVALVTGRRPQAKKKHALDLLASGRPSLIVGTHALIEQNVRIPNAGLIVIDEQHRFGVNQRAALREKRIGADLLVMTATPIPRTLALTLYGNFESILIDTHPPGRRPVQTRCLRDGERAQMYGLVEKEIESKRQVYVVCPEIDMRAEPSARAIANARSAYKEYSGRFPGFSVGLLHGRIPPEEREDTLRRFRRNEIQILVATTMIEVGVDVPNATVIIIEDADRFGLAQLHQLRGRVGRASYESYCFLLAEPTTPEAEKRIEILTSTNDGFKIAEEDLMLRGPGEFLGAAQSGLPRLRVGHLLRDAPLLERARRVAKKLLRADPRLEMRKNRPLRHLLDQQLPAVHF